MARRISIVKTQDYNMTDLEKFVKKLEAEIPSIKLLGVEDSIKLSGFDTQSIRSWYPDKSIREIASILQYLDDNYFDQRSDWFARLTLSDCLRDVAFQRNHEFKLYRIPIEERDSFYVPLLQLFLKKLVRNFHGVEQYREELGHRGFLRCTMSNVTNQNTVITELFTGTPTFDIVVNFPHMAIQKRPLPMPNFHG